MIGSGGDFSRSVWLVLRCWGLTIDFCRFLHPRLLRRVREIELAELRFVVWAGINTWRFQSTYDAYTFARGAIGHGFLLDRPFAFDNQMPLNMHIWRSRTKGQFLDVTRNLRSDVEQDHEEWKGVYHVQKKKGRFYWFLAGLDTITRDLTSHMPQYREKYPTCRCNRKPYIECSRNFPEEPCHDGPHILKKRRLWHWRENKWVKDDLDAKERQVVEAKPAVPTLWAKKLYK